MGLAHLGDELKPRRAGAEEPKVDGFGSFLQLRPGVGGREGGANRRRAQILDP